MIPTLADFYSFKQSSLFKNKNILSKKMIEKMNKLLVDSQPKIVGRVSSEGFGK